jgi:hypothetical protein
VVYYTKVGIEELKTKTTDRIVASTYVQGKGPESDSYTGKPTAY